MKLIFVFFKKNETKKLILVTNLHFFFIKYFIFKSHNQIYISNKEKQSANFKQICYHYYLKQLICKLDKLESF